MPGAPRLLAIAPDSWYANSDFAFQLAAFAEAAQPLGDGAAVYLRAHGWDTAQWLAQWARLPRLDGLRVGITLPVDAELPDASELLSAAGVDFVHLTERDADRPLETWPPLRVSRVCHQPEAARRRWALGADWLVVSPIFATPSKPCAVPLAIAGLEAAVRAVPGRVVALGGITAENARVCLAAGAVGVAVQRAAWTNAAALVTSLREA